jgi:hypothetical protein
MPRAKVWFPACVLPLMLAATARSDVSYEGGDRTSFALNDYSALGQTFTATSRLNILSITAPSWSDNEGGFTLSVYDSPLRGKLLARQAFRDFADNATLYVYVPSAPGPGSFYWEISDRTGQTRVGLYAYRNSTYGGGCAYFDGVPNEGVDFVSAWRYSPYVGKLRRLPLTQRQAPGALAGREGLPQWLWFPEPRVLDGSTRYFRFAFDLPTAARRADLLITADDGYEAYANGKDLGGGGWEHPRHFDIAKVVHKGRNVLAARVVNAVAPAGLIVLLKVTTDDGRTLRFISDTGDRWRSWDREEVGWQEPGFSDAAWKPCLSTGDALSDPWFSHGNVRELARDVFDPRAVLEPLRKEPPMRAEAKVEHGAARLVINGKAVAPFLFASVDLSDFVPDFAAIGCHMFQPRYNLADIWVGPGRYDFTGWDLHLARILYGDPRATFLIMVFLAPPRWWMDQNQDQLVRYADGTGFISDIWGGTMAASFASRKWLDDATAALRAALAHFEASPLRSRILGYHVANGIYGEWHYFGASHLPDVSAPFTAGFRRWAEGAYGSSEALGHAWGLPMASFDDVRAPTADERTHLDCDLFRDPARSRFVSDYYRFLHNLSADTLLHFAHVVKEATGRRVLCGALYCYLMENLWIQEGGHLSGPRALESPDLDYVSNPYSYQGRISDDAGNYLGTARGVGGDGAYRVPVASVRLHKKLYISETDTCSWLEFDPEMTGYGGEGTEDPEGTLRALRRDFAQALGEGVGTWLLELAPGWYADGRIMAGIRRLRGLLERGATRDLSPVAEVAAVCQPESFFYTSHWKDSEAAEFDLFDTYYLDTMNRALHRIGAPVDFLYVDDIERARDYKLYVFLNDFYLTDEQIAAVRRKVCRNGALAVWLYAPGFVAPTALSAERMGDLMGMRVERMDALGPLMVDVTDGQQPLTQGAEVRFGLGVRHGPRFAVVDPQATPLGDWDGTSRCAFAVKKAPDWTSVYIGAAPVPIGLLRNLAASAGVHLYSSRPDIIYANASYLALIANGAGQRVCHLPWPMRRVEGGPVQQGDSPVDVAHGDVVIWERVK